MFFFSFENIQLIYFFIIYTRKFAHFVHQPPKFEQTCVLKNLFREYPFVKTHCNLLKKNIKLFDLRELLENVDGRRD